MKASGVINLVVLGASVLMLVNACDTGRATAPMGLNARESTRLLVAGSSTVAPFITAAAEYFGATTDFATPVVETTGTGGGFRLFCQGDDFETISIATASRPITRSEEELCAERGVTDYVELQLGNDGIVFINALNGPDLEFTDRDIFLALARTIPNAEGELVSNPYQFWSEVNPDLPDMRIEVYGPPPTSGTRDAFVEIVMERGALALPQLAELKTEDRAAFASISHTVRTDGNWLDAGENDTQIIQALLRNSEAIGVVGFSYLDQSADRVKPALIDGTAPSFDSIVSGDYVVSRSLFLYVKRSHLEALEELSAFLDEVYSEAAMGEGGYLVERGLIPISDPLRAEMRDRFR